MRLIYERGQTVGPNPTGGYVYLWSHDGVPRYVGRGSQGRWSAHLIPTRDDFPPRRRYFEQYLPEMACWILKDSLSDAEEAQLEIDTIDRHGFDADGTGKLLNARRGSVVSTSRGSGNKKAFYIRLWRRLKKEGKIAPNAVIERLIDHNPKKNGPMGPSYSYENFELYPAPGERVTVAEHNAKAFNEGFTARQQHEHLTYDATNGFIAVTLSEDAPLGPGFIVPTKDLLYRLALEIGTEDEWRKHCIFRAQRGGKVGGYVGMYDGNVVVRPQAQ
jgi:hypothetical protein